MVGACSSYEEEENAYTVSEGEHEGRRHLEDLGIDGTIILKLILKQ
jgi:hypothetical protein